MEKYCCGFAAFGNVLLTKGTCFAQLVWPVEENMAAGSRMFSSSGSLCICFECFGRAKTFKTAEPAVQTALCSGCQLLSGLRCRGCMGVPARNGRKRRAADVAEPALRRRGAVMFPSSCCMCSGPWRWLS